MTTTNTISQLAADIFARTIAAAEAESKEGPWFTPVDALAKSWDATGSIQAALDLVCERFGCTEAEWFTDHDRFSSVREELHTAVAALHSAYA